ncbi:hypothetical protein KFZ70_04085 [Tamlana fucoidanivorans]|uniref:DUF304 domain-containing protein n=1 Tax=Allotamlana fucoidanivorans TaxID=2583814 RepID=A0A5C4SBS5_9FLAO|nr:hypothetical protein [Tamlana fucoidanivorans]TNJ40590.1 hypothetical protein FGF67_16880 [Tamlana fucoidanivorans]
MTEKRPIYSTFSWIRFVKDIIFVLIILYFVINIFIGLNKEISINAIAIGIFLLAFIIMIDSKELEVYNNILRIKSNHLFGLFSRKTDIKLSNIKDITCAGKHSQKTDLTQDILRLVAPVYDFKNTLTIKTFDNKTFVYDVYIYKEKLDKVISIIKKTFANTV